jgi:hypothetical protein
MRVESGPTISKPRGLALLGRAGFEMQVRADGRAWQLLRTTNCKGRSARRESAAEPQLGVVCVAISRLPILGKGWPLVYGEAGHVVVAVAVAVEEWSELSICQSTLHQNDCSTGYTACRCSTLQFAAPESTLPRTKRTPRLEDGLA